MRLDLSSYGQASSQPSPVNRMMDAFASDFRDGVDINLGVGYVNEKTIPVACLPEALQAVICNPSTYRQAFNYGGPEGSPNLIASLRRFLAGPETGHLDPETLSRKRLVIGPCGATSILDALTNVLAPGIVVTSDPAYYIYSDAIERKGFRILAVPEDGEGMELPALHRKIEALGARAASIAFVYVVTVNNPSATILSNARRRALFDVVSALSRAQNRRIPLFYDLAYELLLHDPAAEPFASVLPDDTLDAVYEIGTLSKVLAPALRIGYLLGPHGPLMNAVVQRTSDAGLSAPLFVQEMASYLLDHQIAGQLRTVNAGYREKALTVGADIRRYLGPHLAECRGGSAGFYYYLTFRKIETHPESPFFRFLTRTTGMPDIDGPPCRPHPRVMYIPGTYCVHPEGDLAETGRRQFRLSYGFEEPHTITQALALMRDAVEFASAYLPNCQKIPNATRHSRS